MAKKDETVSEPDVQVEAPSAEPQEAQHVTQHLDRDLNDPRNAAPTPVLPSLNDPGQS